MSEAVDFPWRVLDLQFLIKDPATSERDLCLHISYFNVQILVGFGNQALHQLDSIFRRSIFLYCRWPYVAFLGPQNFSKGEHG